jgi:hypothetical protein
LRSKVVRGNCIYDSQNFQTKGRQPVSLKKIPAQSVKKGRVADKRLLITFARKNFLKNLEKPPFKRLTFPLFCAIIFSGSKKPFIFCLTVSHC